MITQAGQEWTQDGLQLSLEAHRDEHEKNTRQLMNLAAGRPQAATLPPYNPRDNQWPLHVYHPDGRDMAVADQAALDRAMETGFTAKVVHKVPVATATEAAKKQAAAESQLAVQNLLILKMQEQLDAINTAPAKLTPPLKNPKE